MLDKNIHTSQIKRIIDLYSNAASSVRKMDELCEVSNADNNYLIGISEASAYQIIVRKLAIINLGFFCDDRQTGVEG